ncbi:methyltransferase domain-containing protein [Thiothrix litoralis]|jgi:SAM-dependent methyltransferase|uniref:Methyltransferase domain-containing protein n=1 Tax=Thiothrix litoralis TaxID=2891210 RepID=A0ABX7WNE8_9GAMM|nr:methyltransferase domain-containing protein [Thiothrix litoralis]QTR44945.1 methyltransferase domain-containing protein [Thiothrix litoralis]
MTNKVLNVGGNSKAIPLPPQYAGFEHILLDIDPSGNPDVVCDARQLDTLTADQYDAIYCSHNLEHYYAHDVPKVLAGFRHVLKDSGFVHIRVPDVDALMRTVLAKNLDLTDTLYQSPAGPITALDVLYGYGKKIAESGEDFFAHKTGFTPKSLLHALRQHGFPWVFTQTGNLEIQAVAFTHEPSDAAKQLFKLQVMA